MKLSEIILNKSDVAGESKNDNCKFCQNDGVTIHGDYTELVIDGSNRLISAFGDGEAYQEIKYCPMCGRKLD